MTEQTLVVLVMRGNPDLMMRRIKKAFEKEVQIHRCTSAMHAAGNQYLKEAEYIFIHTDTVYRPAHLNVVVELVKQALPKAKVIVITNDPTFIVSQAHAMYAPGINPFENLKRVLEDLKKPTAVTHLS